MARDPDTGAMGVLLTGRGEDSAVRLLAVRPTGRYTIAGDESTAVVYGMPAAAIASGVLDLVSCKVL